MSDKIEKEYEELVKLCKSGFNKHSKTINWLIDNKMHKAKGRTTALAMGFILLSMNNHNERIYVWDHFPFQSSKINMIKAISNLLDNTPMIKKCFLLNQDYIIYKGIKN